MATATMTVGDVYKQLDGGGDSDKQSNAQLTQHLTDISQGHFNGLESIFINNPLDPHDPKPIEQMAATCLKLTNTEFNGDAHAALNFLKTVQQNPSIKKMDFNELVNDGAAHQLIQMSRQNPAGFNQVMQGNYLTPASLLARVTPPPAAAPAQAPALATTRPAAAPATRPAAPRAPG